MATADSQLQLMQSQSRRESSPGNKSISNQHVENHLVHKEVRLTFYFYRQPRHVKFLGYRLLVNHSNRHIKQSLDCYKNNLGGNK